MGDAGSGTFFFDFDNDGHLDLLAVNGSTLEDKGDTKHLVRSALSFSGQRERMASTTLLVRGLLAQLSNRKLMGAGLPMQISIRMESST